MTRPLPALLLTDEELATELRTAPVGERRLNLQAEALRRLPVAKLEGGGYVVASRTTEGAWWRVDPFAPEGERCSCPATVVTCWHQRMVLRRCRLEDAMRSRPTPPPNVSALVD